ncbi:hypothetical protein [Pedobacter sandarakinus]|uniref:hypothetical protein n=1 Tax=Pedobacter sandarakinus TaxID=353156 RepID=UPI002247C9F6|nr:hypothetical protein [Pedobacter sandarakinus]MCX2575452.1 hypothetical protein [Pedobacter sandarakinus]
MIKLLNLFPLLVILMFGLSCKDKNALITIKEPDLPQQPIDYSYKMGINLNEQVDVTDYNDLADSKTKWVRCFVEVIDVYKAGSLNIDPKIAAYNLLKSKGYKTVLNLKFDFKQNGFPAVNSTEWNNYLNFIQPLLAKVMANTDVLVVGNEPFIEADQASWNEPLNSFYRAACERANNYFTLNNIKKPMFLGALDRLDEANRQNDPGHNNLLAFVKATPYLAGVDIHSHHAAVELLTSAINFAKSKIRDNQKILVTEFSLMPYWKSNNNAAISSAFITAANASATDRIFTPPANVTTNFQYIDYALKNPRPAEEWYAFCRNSPYIESRKNYLCAAYNILKNAGNVYLSFYALRQSYPLNTDFTATTDPWVLNGLFMNRSVEMLNGRSQKSYSFLDLFLKIAVDENPCN